MESLSIEQQLKLGDAFIQELTNAMYDAGPKIETVATSLADELFAQSERYLQQGKVDDYRLYSNRARTLRAYISSPGKITPQGIEGCLSDDPSM